MSGAVTADLVFSGVFGLVGLIFQGIFGTNAEELADRFKAFARTQAMYNLDPIRGRMLGTAPYQRILDRHAGALRGERQHRMGGIADQRDMLLRP